MWIDKTISQKKRFLSDCIKNPMQQLAKQCSMDWGNPEQLTKILHQLYSSIPKCQFLYCFDVLGKQFSGGVSDNDINMSTLGREIQERPYFQGLLPYKGMSLSSIYLSLRNSQACITALYAVKNDDELLGFVAADFFLNDLPKIELVDSNKTEKWSQYKGDPSIRSTVFLQKRTNSIYDKDLSRVLSIVSLLLKQHGVFHTQIDFSSSRLVVWSLQAPFNFEILATEALFSKTLFKTYQEQAYSTEAVVTKHKIDKVLVQFKALRNADDTIYLRSATLNIINGTVGLTFSCDGFHLMTVDEFLGKDIKFWTGGHALSNYEASAI